MKDVPLRAYDKNGEIVDVEIVPGKIDVDLTISSPSKTLPIEIVPTGDVSFGLGIESITSNVNEVTVFGDSEALEGLTSIPVKINVDGLKEGKTYKAEVTKPVGVRSVSVNNITVTVSLAASASARFSDIPIISRNLDADYAVQAVDDKSSKVDVTVKGVKSVINSISGKYNEYIYPYIDLSGYKEGTYDVEVQIDGRENRLTYIATPKKVKIKIVKK